MHNSMESTSMQQMNSADEHNEENLRLATEDLQEPINTRWEELENVERTSQYRVKLISNSSRFDAHHDKCYNWLRHKYEKLYYVPTSAKTMNSNKYTETQSRKQLSNVEKEHRLEEKHEFSEKRELEKQEKDKCKTRETTPHALWLSIQNDVDVCNAMYWTKFTFPAHSEIKSSYKHDDVHAWPVEVCIVNLENKSLRKMENVNKNKESNSENTAVVNKELESSKSHDDFNNCYKRANEINNKRSNVNSEYTNQITELQILIDDTRARQTNSTQEMTNSKEYDNNFETYNNHCKYNSVEELLRETTRLREFERQLKLTTTLHEKYTNRNEPTTVESSINAGSNNSTSVYTNLVSLSQWPNWLEEMWLTEKESQPYYNGYIVSPSRHDAARFLIFPQSQNNTHNIYINNDSTKNEINDNNVELYTWDDIVKELYDRHKLYGNNKEYTLTSKQKEQQHVMYFVRGSFQHHRERCNPAVILCNKHNYNTNKSESKLQLEAPEEQKTSTEEQEHEEQEESNVDSASSCIHTETEKCPCVEGSCTNLNNNNNNNNDSKSVQTELKVQNMHEQDNKRSVKCINKKKQKQKKVSEKNRTGWHHQEYNGSILELYFSFSARLPTYAKETWEQSLLKSNEYEQWEKQVEQLENKQIEQEQLQGQLVYKSLQVESKKEEQNMQKKHEENVKSEVLQTSDKAKMNMQRQTCVNSKYSELKRIEWNKDHQLIQQYCWWELWNWRSQCLPSYSSFTRVKQLLEWSMPHLLNVDAMDLDGWWHSRHSERRRTMESHKMEKCEMECSGLKCTWHSYASGNPRHAHLLQINLTSVLHHSHPWQDKTGAMKERMKMKTSAASSPLPTIANNNNKEEKKIDNSCKTDELKEKQQEKGELQHNLNSNIKSCTQENTEVNCETMPDNNIDLSHPVSSQPFYSSTSTLPLSSSSWSTWTRLAQTLPTETTHPENNSTESTSHSKVQEPKCFLEQEENDKYTCNNNNNYRYHVPRIWHLSYFDTYQSTTQHFLLPQWWPCKHLTTYSSLTPPLLFDFPESQDDEHSKEVEDKYEKILEKNTYSVQEDGMERQQSNQTEEEYANGLVNNNNASIQNVTVETAVRDALPETSSAQQELVLLESKESKKHKSEVVKQQNEEETELEPCMQRAMGTYNWNWSGGIGVEHGMNDTHLVCRRKHNMSCQGTSGHKLIQLIEELEEKKQQQQRWSFNTCNVQHVLNDLTLYGKLQSSGVVEIPLFKQLVLRLRHDSCLTVPVETNTITLPFINLLPSFIIKEQKDCSKSQRNDMNMNNKNEKYQVQIKAHPYFWATQGPVWDAHLIRGFENDASRGTHLASRWYALFSLELQHDQQTNKTRTSTKKKIKTKTKTKMTQMQSLEYQHENTNENDNSGTAQKALSEKTTPTRNITKKKLSNNNNKTIPCQTTPGFLDKLHYLLFANVCFSDCPLWRYPRASLGFSFTSPMPRILIDQFNNFSHYQLECSFSWMVCFASRSLRSGISESDNANKDLPRLRVSPLETFRHVRCGITFKM